MGVPFYIVILESEAEKSNQTDDKNKLQCEMASQVRHFRVAGKPIRHYTTPHDNIGFNPKGSEDTTAEITKKIAGSNHPIVV